MVVSNSVIPVGHITATGNSGCIAVTGGYAAAITGSLLVVWTAGQEVS